jgi:hypothetical protein
MSIFQRLARLPLVVIDCLRCVDGHLRYDRVGRRGGFFNLFANLNTLKHAQN